MKAKSLKIFRSIFCERTEQKPGHHASHVNTTSLNAGQSFRLADQFRQARQQARPPATNLSPGKLEKRSSSTNMRLVSLQMLVSGKSIPAAFIHVAFRNGP
jgi:hypothetical protein